ncbi:MAG: DUF255 domain-containing protein [Gammaproteobacteria bacterium]|nr:DUF255 domain-containing protein [Gammaproteobacteria bacterium]
MMKNKFILLQKLVVIIFGLTSLYSASANSAEANWKTWSTSTLVQAKEEHRLILIALTAEWCMFCKKMDQTTYRDNAVLNIIRQHYIAIKADEALYPELARRFAHVGRPGTIILDSQGNELVTKSGYLKPQWMLWMLQAMAEQMLFSDPENGPTAHGSTNG